MDAYRKMQKTAMEKRAPLVSVARAIIRVESQRDEANQAKKWLMRERRMTEQEAYRYLVKGSGKGRAYGFRLCKAAPGRGGVA